MGQDNHRTLTHNRNRTQKWGIKIKIMIMIMIMSKIMIKDLVSSHNPNYKSDM